MFHFHCVNLSFQLITPRATHFGENVWKKNVYENENVRNEQRQNTNCFKELPSVCKYEWWIILWWNWKFSGVNFHQRFGRSFAVLPAPKSLSAWIVNERLLSKSDKKNCVFPSLWPMWWKKSIKLCENIYKTRYHSTDNRVASACTHKSSEWKEWRKTSENVENSFLRWGMESEKWERERQWGGKMEILCVCRCRKKL